MNKIDWTKIKIKNKYIFFKFNLITNKVSLLSKGNSKKELNENTKGKKLKSEEEVLLMKFDLMKDWSPDTKISINMLGGPIKITFTIYQVTEKGKLKKKEDKRAIQFVYYTFDFYQKNKIKSEHLKKLSIMAFKNSLEKRLLAPKLITQILKVQ
jgi:hypothetical protein